MGAKESKNTGHVSNITKTVPLRKLPLKDAEILLHISINISHSKTVSLGFQLNEILSDCLLLKIFTVDTPATTEQDQLAKMF